MTITNRLLVIWSGGAPFVVEDAASIVEHGARMKPLRVDVDTRQEAETLAEAELARFAQPVEQITAGVPRDPALAGLRMYDDVDLGDTVTMLDRDALPADHRLLGIAGEQDDKTGNVTYVPIAKSLLEEEAVRTARALKRMADGTLGGRSSVASPPSTAPSVVWRKPKTQMEIYSWPTRVDEGETIDVFNGGPAGPVKFDQPGRLCWIEYVWDPSPPTVDVPIVGKRGTTTLFTHTLPAGEETHNEYPAIYIPRNKLTLVGSAFPAESIQMTAHVHVMHFEL